MLGLMHKTFKYRIYPGPGQRKVLEAALESCRFLYNHFLGVRKNTYEGTGYSVGHYELLSTLPALKKVQPRLGSVYSQVLQNVSVRVDLAFKSFFRRAKAGETPGYPRFRGAGRYTSFTYPQPASGRCADIRGGKVHLSKIGLIKAVIHRPLEGRPKTCTVSKSSTGKWYVTFSCEVEPPVPLPTSPEVVGIDLGLKTFATLSTGEKIESPGFFPREEKNIARAHRRLSKTEKGTPERKRRKKVVARVYERMAWRREDFIHQESRRLVNRFGTLFIEDLSVNRMVQKSPTPRRKSIMDAAWTGFTNLLSVKAEWAGRTFGKVNPAYTTQDCHKCGNRQKLDLDDRVYRCPSCGLTMCRDVNASLNILRLGQQSL